MDIQNILLFIVAVLTSLLSFFVLYGNKTPSNKAFSLFILNISLWTFGLAIFHTAVDLPFAQAIAQLYYLMAAGIAFFFMIFSLYFPSEKQIKKTTLVLFTTPYVLLAVFLILDPTFLIQQVFILDDGTKGVIINYPTYIAYTVYFIAYVLGAYINLFRSYRKSNDNVIKSQLKFIFIGTIVPYLLAMYFDLFLPIVNYRYIWIGPLFAFAVTAAIAYAIWKHHLFDVKVIVTEVLLFILWIFILVRTLLSQSYQDEITNLALLLLTIVVGIFLIRSVIREVKTREKIEKLASDLEKSNTDLEKANEHLKELDQLKSEFVSLATHQIRAPLTAIKGYISEIFEGDFGPFSEEIRKPLVIVSQSTENLINIVGDFLNISRIDQGRMVYDFSSFDMAKVAKEVAEEIRPNIERAKLRFNIEVEPGNYMVSADIGKMKQIVGNLIDNAIKYTKEGWIRVHLKTNSHIRIEISDSGVGISPETMPKLFQKFSRAKDANEVNVIGTGLGLYVVKTMVEAQHGKVWAESEGAGKGSTFIVELPVLHTS